MSGRSRPMSAVRRLIACALIWCVLLLCGLWLVHSAEVRQRTTVDGVFAARAETSAEFLGSYAQTIFAQNRVLAAAALQGEVRPAAFNDLMRANGIEAAVVLDGRGRALASYPEDARVIGRQLASKYAHLGSALSGVPAVSNVVLSVVRHVPVVAFAVPFQTPSGRRVYSAAYEVSRTPLSSYLTSDFGRVPEAIYLVDATDKVVSSGGTEAVRARILSDIDPSIGVSARQPGSATIQVGGAPWRIDTVVIAGTPWRLVVTTPTNLLYGPTNGVSVWTLRLGLLALALAGLVTIVLLERMLRQRSRLVDQQLESAAVLDNTTDAFVGTDHTGHVVAWNRAAEALFGRTQREALGRPFTALVSLGDRGPASDRGLSDLLPQGDSRPTPALELTAQAADGQSIPVEVSVSATQLSGGERTYAFFRDIRARRVADQRKRIFAQAAESAGDAIFTRDRGGRMLSWNSSAERLFGWSEADCVGRSLDHPMMDTEGESMARMIESVTRTQTVQYAETYRRHRDGHRVDIGLTVAPLLDEDGTPAGVTSIARDIGDRLRLEQQLRHSAAVFRSAFDDALLGMCMTESDGRLIRVNAVFAAMLGRSPESLIGSMLDDVTHPDYRGRSGPRMQQTLLGDTSGFRDEMCYLGHDDVPVWAETSVSLVRDQFDEPLHLVTQVVDVTARRVALRERDSRDAMLAAVIANSQSLIYIKDLDGRYLLANEPFQRAFGVTEADLLGRVDVFLHPDVLATAGVGRSLPSAEAQHLEQWSDTGLGRRLYESVTFPLHDAEGRFYAVCAVCLDVTEKRSAVAAIARALDEAVAATAAKSAFLSTMSHEIRTPMNAVIGLTGLLLETQLDPQQREFVETINSSGDTLLTVINDVLDFSKIEAGQLTLEERQFELTDLVEGSVDLIAASAATKGLDLICYVDGDCPAAVVGDLARLRQVLVNLLSNAVKFTAAGDVLLSVSARTGPGDRATLTFSVTDTGIGIPSERMDRLFRSFSQVDDSTTREYGGTGLGLAISQRLVQAMGGEISASSIAGTGSTFMFSVSFPVPSAPSVGADSSPGWSAATSTLAGKRALVVDDNATNRRILTLQLARYSMSCVALGRPDEALASMAGGATYDVVLLDMRMPDMDGLTLAAQIRRLEPDRGPPMILLTSLHGPIDIDPQVIGAVLTKPVKSASLRSTLLGLLAPPLVTAHGSSTPEAGETRTEDGRTLRVLLAEDNRVNQRVAQLMLRKLGHRVDTVGNGEEALAAAHAAHYDVILMDLQMPVMDGLEATRRIRTEFAEASQPHIIAMTASALVEDQTACLAAGMDGHLGKPVRQYELRRAMDQVYAVPGKGAA